MKMKTLASAVAFAAAMASGSASAIVVGGVDFGNLGLVSHLDTTSIAQTLSTGDGQTVSGYGVVNQINGLSNYAGTDKLFFITRDYTTQNWTPTGTELIGGVIDLYLGADFNLLDQSSAANLGMIGMLTEWASFNGHGNLGGGASANATIVGNGQLTGAPDQITITGGGLLDVAFGDGFGIAAVETFLDGNGEADAIGGAADVTFTSSLNASVLNPFDTCTFSAGEWCLQGSADLRGDTNVNQVPEPVGLALLGAGLLGFGVAKRRRAKV